MKILYGVQATGNGHITRARCLGPELQRAGAQVDYLFSGRDPGQLFDMVPFGDFRVRKGLTFVTSNGRMKPLATLQQADLKSLWRDIRHLDTRSYDLVITDFEPVTAWAARRQGTRSLAIGHQYAFRHRIPKCHESIVSHTVMRWFAPAGLEVGFHWHHFGQPILPPMIEASEAPDADKNQVLVYLPFDEASDVLAALQPVEGYRFHFFTADLAPGQHGTVEIHAPGRERFQKQLLACQSVICGAGFELASEALNLGRRILVKPTRGQMEQESNARALEILGWAQTLTRLDTQRIRQWLSGSQPVRVRYPNVARALSDWVLEGRQEVPETLIRDLWQKVGRTAPLSGHKL